MGVLTPLQALADTDPEEHIVSAAPETLEKELNEKSDPKNPLAGTVLYVSDLMIANGDTAEETKKALHDKGYMVYDCDLNEGTQAPKHNDSTYAAFLSLTERQVPKKYTYLGYKITTDRTKAITDLKLMDQEGGYEALDYLDFAEKHMPGLTDMVTGMRAACIDLRERLEKGSYSAKVAKEYLDLFCVPETSNGKTGPNLGDYLLDPRRTYEEYRDINLVLNTLVLNVIRQQLALGLTETSLKTQLADGGENADGTVASRYTSYTGAVSPSKLIDSDDWLITAAEKMREDKNFADVNKTEVSADFAEIMATYGMQLTAFKRAVNDGNLTDTAKAYLESVIIEENGGLISDALGLGPEGCNAYQLLTLGSDRMLCLFFSYIPTYSEKGAFHDALEICASDYQHRLPEGFNVDRYYDIDWAHSAVDAVKADQKRPSTKTERAPYTDDIDSFIQLMQVYITQYKEGMAEYEKNGNQIVLPDEMTDEEADKTISDAIDNQTEISNVPYVFHVSVKNAFSKYMISDDQSLLDYLISAIDGKDVGDESVRAAVFPVVRALGVTRLYCIKSCGVLGFLSNTLMSENELGGTEMALDDYRMGFVEETGTEQCSIWVGTHKDLIEAGGGVAVTNKDVYNNLLGSEDNRNKAFSNEIPMTEKLQAHLLKCAMAGGIMLVSSLIFTAISTTILSIWGAVSTATWMTMGITAASMAAAAFSCLATLALVGVAIVVLTAVVFGILYLVELFTPEPDPVYTYIPTIMIDSSKSNKGELTNIAKYYVVRDPNDAPADINAFVSRKWLALYYTRDESAGSPMILGPDNSFFDSTVGTNNRPDDKCMPLSKFLRSKAFNLNNNCYFDRIKLTERNENGTYPTVSGKYLYFYTEDSDAGKTKGVVGGKYISALKIAHSRTDYSTQWYLENMAGYELLSETNLSPDCKYNTYIAYQTTNDANLALRDIRAAFCTDAVQLAYGDVVYYNVLGSEDETRSCPAKTCNTKEEDRVDTSFYYSLYTAKKDSANQTRADLVGDPILTDSLSYVTNLADVPEGYDVVSYFAGVPLDFNSYQQEGNMTFSKHCYLIYASEKPETKESTDASGKPETKESTDTTGKTDTKESTDTSDTEYLAGFAFFSGSEDWLGDGSVPGETLQAYAGGSFGAKLIPTNLTPSLYNNKEDRTYLGYVTTKNPKKALTDLAVFTGEPKGSYLPGTITVGNSSYCVCDVFTQGDYYYYGAGGGYRQRQTRISHAYFTNATSEFYGLYWYYPSNIYQYVMPRALYGCGPTTEGKPIKISDVLFSDSSSAAPVNNSKNPQANAHLYRLEAGSDPVSLNNVTDIGTNWHSVHSIERYYYDDYDANGNLLSSFDMGLGMDDPKGDPTGTGHLYMYYKNGDSIRRRGNYVSNIRISGSVAEGNAYNTAVISALAGAEDIVNIDDPITLTDRSFDFGKNREMYIYTGSLSSVTAPPEVVKGATKDYDDSCYLVSVSYSDLASASIRAARVVKQEKDAAPLASVMDLPLYSASIPVKYTKTSLAPVGGDEGKTHEDSNGKTVADYSAYALYASSSGYDTNRVKVRFINTSLSTDRTETVSGAGTDLTEHNDVAEYTGVAEYYVGEGDTSDPFLLKTIDGRRAAAICLQSYTLDENGQNTDKYIEDIVIVDAQTYDGNMDLAAAKLGVMGYPYIVDYDISESARTGVTGTVSALGIRRTDKAANAVKDVRISSDDLGIYYDMNGIRYERVNEKPVKLSSTAENGAYLYITYGASSDSVLWSEIKDKNIPLDDVDWFNLDYTEASRKDTGFNDTKKLYFAQHPGLSSSVDAYRAELNKNKTVDLGLKSDWEEKTALTNIGFVPSVGSPEQNARIANDLPTKDIYWAGCSAYKEDKFIVPVTDKTAKITACTMDGTESLSGLRFTNNGNKRFAALGAEEEAGTSASVFSNYNLWIIVGLAAVSIGGLAAAYILYRKKQKNA